MLDADGSTDPAEIPASLRRCWPALTSPRAAGSSLAAGAPTSLRVRRVGNWALAKVVNLIWGGQYSDLCYGYNAFWRRCLPFVTPDCEGFEVETLMNIRASRGWPADP